jgi:hypothetical protein
MCQLPVTDSSRCRVAPVAYLFDKKGLIQISPTAATGAVGATEAGTTFDDLFDLAVEAGAEDVREVESDQSDNEVLWEVSDGMASVPGGDLIGSIDRITTTSYSCVSFLYFIQRVLRWKFSYLRVTSVTSFRSVTS